MNVFLVWVTFNAAYLAQAFFRETTLWAALKQSFALWQQNRRDLRG
jgi:hypothetical protein